MKAFALPLLIVLASSGTAFAAKTNNQVDNRQDDNQTSENTTRSIYKDDSRPAHTPSLEAVESKSKSLQERERERKGLPRYWNG